MFLLYDRRICTHSIDPSLADGEFPSLGLVLVPVVVVPEAEHNTTLLNTIIALRFVLRPKAAGLVRIYMYDTSQVCVLHLFKIIHGYP